MADEPSTSRFERFVALLGWVWIPLVWLFAVTADGMPTPWSWALTYWAGYGLYECTATLSDKRQAWSRNLTVARYVGIAALVAASLHALAL